MKRSHLMLVLLSLMVFRCEQQLAFASALSAIVDMGKEFTKTIFTDPLHSIKGMTFGYGVRSLSSSPRSLKAESALPAEDAEHYLKHEQQERDEIIEKYRKNRERARKLALNSTPEIYDFLIYWRGIAKSGLWFYRMYSARSTKKQLTKAEEARKQEFFCGNNDLEKLQEYCTTALQNNSAFSEGKGWHDDDTRIPKCELKHIILEKYDYMSQRGVLTCPILIKRENEHDKQSFVYISSIDDPPKKRLAFYVFTEADEDVQKYAEKLAQKNEKLSTKSAKKKDTKSGLGLRSLLPAITLLRGFRNSEVGLTKSLLLPATNSAIRAMKNSDGTSGAGIRSYLPFAGGKKSVPELPPGKPLRVVSLVVKKQKKSQRSSADFE